MALNKCIVLLLLSAVAYARIREVSDNVLSDLSVSALPTLQRAVNKESEDLTAAVDAHIPVENACEVKRQRANTTCTSCVRQRCNNKRDSCPNLVNLVTEKIPSFFVNTIPTKSGQAAAKLASIPNLLKNRVEAIGGDIRSRVSSVVNGAGNIAIVVGAEFKKATAKAKDIAENAGKVVINFGADAINKLKDVYNTLKNALTGKRRRSLNLVRRAVETRPTRPTSPPSCSSLLRNNNGCEYYAAPHICPSCEFNSETGCPGWKASNDRVEQQTQESKWIEDNEVNPEFGVQKAEYDTRYYDFDTGFFANVEVTVILFGNAYKFTIAEPLDLLEADEATARVIVQYSIAAAKITKESSSG